MRGPLASLILIAALLPGDLSAEPLRITGRVLLPADAADVRIELRSQELRFEEGARAVEGKPVPPLATATRNLDGRYVLQAPGPGFYRVRIEAKGFLPLEQSLPALVEDVELDAAAPSRAVSLRTRVFDPAALSPPGIHIFVIPNSPLPQDEDDSRWYYAARETVTDETGMALLPHRKGESLIFIAARPQAVAFGGPLEVDRIEAIRLGRGTTLEIRGIDGKPAAGALVRLGSMPLTLTGEDGRLNVSISSEGAGFLVEAADGTGAEALLKRDSPSVIRIALQKRQAITGRVLDASTRQPLKGAVVHTGEAGARTDADGSFRLALLPQSRNLYLSAAAPGHLGGSAEIQLGKVEPVLLLLEPAGSLSGQVVDASGMPVQRARVRAMPVRIAYGPNQPPEGAAFTDSEGKFRIHPLRSGTTYAVAVDGRGFAPARKFADLPAPGREAAPLRIVVTPGVSASGRVVDEGGIPLSGAAVSLHPLPDSGALSRWPEHIQDRPLRITADTEGRFRFPHLRAGRFELHAKHDGFSPTLVSGVEIPEGNRELDLGEIRLAAGAAIEGRVVDDRGRPLADARVTLSLTTPTTVPRRAVDLDLPKPVRSEPDGTFRFQDLPAGSRMDLWVHADGYLGRRAPGVKVPTSEPLRIELRRGRALAGRVVGPDGEPVPRARIGRVTTIKTSLGGDSSSSSSADTRSETDEEGRFQLIELEPGTLNLLVQADGFLPKVVEGIQIPEEAEPPPVEVALEEGAILEGRVLDGNSKPLPGVRVRASLKASGGLDFGGAPAVADGEGRYRLAGLASGHYEVIAERPESEHQVWASTEIRSGVHQLDIRFPSGVEVSGIVTDAKGIPAPLAQLSLVPVGGGYISNTTSSADGSFLFPAVPDGDFQLRGRVAGFAESVAPNEVRVSGQPVSGLELRLAAGAVITGRLLGVSIDELPGIRIHAMRQATGALSLSGLVEQPGVYRIPGVTPGTWRVQASLDQGRSAVGTVEVPAGGEAAVLDLEFAKGFGLSGRVLVDGEPFAQASVALAGMQSRTASTAYDGSFAIPDLQPGMYTLAVVLESGAGYARKLEVADDQEIAVSISTGRIEGRVLSPEGLPVPGVVVSLTGEDPQLKARFEGPSVRSDELGIFRLGRLPAGTYRAALQAEGFAPAETRVLVPPGGTVHVEIALERQ